ncbi:MAG TPA: hypothetical protein VKP30_18665 [Polyangiaceae bacterium]|nr:hypothetical protein [Polyangiaceae bacterium]
MKEPLRWLDDASTSTRLREVLNARGSLPIMPSALRKDLRTYAVGLAAQGVVQTAAGSWIAKGVLSKFAAGTLVKFAMVAGLMGAAGTAGYVAVGHRLDQAQSAREPGAEQAHREATGAVKQPIITSHSSAKRSLPVEASRDTPDNAQRESTTVQPQATPALAASSPDGSLSDEAQLLETARESLDNPARALALVRRHEVRYPKGQLGAERDLIAVDALLRLGRRSEAERRAAPRLKQDPNSLYAKRLRQLLGNE